MVRSVNFSRPPFPRTPYPTPRQSHEEQSIRLKALGFEAQATNLSSKDGGDWTQCHYSGICCSKFARRPDMFSLCLRLRRRLSTRVIYIYIYIYIDIKNTKIPKFTTFPQITKCELCILYILQNKKFFFFIC